MLERVVLALILALVPMAAMPTEPPPERGGPPYYDALVDTLHPQDRRAMKGWEERMRAQLEEVAADPMDTEIAGWAADIFALLDADRLPIADAREIVGTWRVRSMQVTALGAYVYSWFPARILPEASALFFEKDSGSQRHRGFMALEPRGAYYLFAGALYYGYEEERIYSAHMGPDAANADPEMDAIAHVYKLGPEHFMMAFAPDGGRFRLYEMRR